MATPMQAPTAIADGLARRPCFWCNGSGRTPNDNEQRYDECNACDASGSRPASLPQLAERIAA